VGFVASVDEKTVPIFQDIARGYPPGSDYVCPLSATEDTVAVRGWFAWPWRRPMFSTPIAPFALDFPVKGSIAVTINCLGDGSQIRSAAGPGRTKRRGLGWCKRRKGCGA
jgi:hypothetical protein